MPLTLSDLQPWESKVGLILQEEINRRADSMLLDGSAKILGLTLSQIRALKSFYLAQTGKPATDIVGFSG